MLWVFAPTQSVTVQEKMGIIQGLRGFSFMTNKQNKYNGASPSLVLLCAGLNLCLYSGLLYSAPSASAQSQAGSESGSESGGGMGRRRHHHRGGGGCHKHGGGENGDRASADGQQRQASNQSTVQQASYASSAPSAQSTVQTYSWPSHSH
jgi:hypothetical protein